MTYFIFDSKQQSVIQQLNARRGRLIVMCSKGDAASVCPNESCRVIEVPQVEDCLQPVINVVPLQVCFTILFFIAFLLLYFILTTVLHLTKGNLPILVSKILLFVCLSIYKLILNCMLIVISISLLFLELVRYLNINFSVWISHANFAHLFPFRHLESLEADLIFVYCTKEDLYVSYIFQRSISFRCSYWHIISLFSGDITWTSLVILPRVSQRNREFFGILTHCK